MFLALLFWLLELVDACCGVVGFPSLGGLFWGWLLVIDFGLIVLIVLSFFVCFIVFWICLWLLFVSSVCLMRLGCCLLV